MQITYLQGRQHKAAYAKGIWPPAVENHASRALPPPPASSTERALAKSQQETAKLLAEKEELLKALAEERARREATEEKAMVAIRDAERAALLRHRSDNNPA